MRPDFGKIDWRSNAEATAASEHSGTGDWLSPELIAIKPSYSREDIVGLEHLQYAAGVFFNQLLHRRLRGQRLK